MTRRRRAARRASVARGALALAVITVSLALAPRQGAALSDRGIYAPPAGVPSWAELQARGAVIGTINVHVENIFNPYDPRESAWLYRTANALHMRTRERVVRAQLLFKSGEPVHERRMAETERILRGRQYLFDAWIVPESYDPATNIVNVSVTVRDVWTLSPSINYSHTGGTNKTGFNIQEQNLLGTGSAIELAHVISVDRISTIFSYSTSNLFGSWWKTALSFADNSDGHVAQYDLEHPFYSLDTRTAYGVSGSDASSRINLYNYGEIVGQFLKRENIVQTYLARSGGDIDGWTRRWYVGYRYDDAVFRPDPTTTTPYPTPDERRLSYPYFAWEVDQDRYAKAENQDQIGRTEDLYYGFTLYTELGFASPAFGADRNALLPRVTVGDGWHWDHEHQQRLFVGLGGSGRIEYGRLDNGIANFMSRYYWVHNEHALFYASVNGTATKRLDGDNQVLLGGDTGLRGYPIRYQAGSSDVLGTVEERLYSNWYPFRLVRVGGAVFVDSGRMWGTGPFGAAPLGWLSDAGFGLRIGNSRSGLGNVLHVDFSWTLNSAPNAPHFQVTVHTEASF
jgi:outer membrane protein assembly factor BamA